MTTQNQQVTPADATIVTSGLGRKGPEERELPASLKQDMDLCLHILRDVLGEFDEKLLTVFDEVRLNAVDESACLLYTSPSPRDRQKSRMPSSA